MFNLLAFHTYFHSCPSQDRGQVEGSEGQEGCAEGSAQPQEEEGQDQPYFPKTQDSASEEAAQVPQEECTTQEQVSLLTEKGAKSPFWGSMCSPPWSWSTPCLVILEKRDLLGKNSS